MWQRLGEAFNWVLDRLTPGPKQSEQFDRTAGGPAFDYLPTDADRSAAMELVGELATGDWVLFAGAGVSKNSSIPDGRDLVSKIQAELTQLGFDASDLDPDNLPSACTRFVYQHPSARNGLITLLRAALDTTGKQPSQVHFDLLALDPEEIMTTNVEDLWEKIPRNPGDDLAVIVRAEDWGLAGGKFKLIKLHGDLKQEDTLVFSDDDLDSYSYKKLIMSNHLRQRFVSKSILFVGYRWRDASLRREIRLVIDNLGGAPRKHFAIFDSMPAWETQYFQKSLKIKPIAIGTYDRLSQFLKDLLVEIDRRRPKLRPRIGGDLKAVLPSLQEQALVDLFSSRYEKVRRALEDWKLILAETELEQLLEEVHRIRDRFTGEAGLIIDFHQRVLLAMANVKAWRGKSQEALEILDKTRSLGALSDTRLPQAVALLLNVHAASQLADLVATGRLQPDLERKVRVWLAWHEGDVDQAMSLFPGQTDDLDLILMKVRISLQRGTFSDLQATLGILDTAWEFARGSAPAMLEVTELTNLAMRQAIAAGQTAEWLNPREILRTTRMRYDEALAAFRQIGNQFPEGLVSCLAAVLMFHDFLGEEEAVARYQEELVQNPTMTRQKVIAEHVRGLEPRSVETIEALHREGFIDHAERAILLARQLESSGMPEPAEQELRRALEASTPHTDLVIGSLVDLLVKRRRFEEAEDLLQSRPDLDPALRIVLSSLVVRGRSGPDAAIKLIREALEGHPRNPVLLDQMIRLLMEKQSKVEGT